MVQQNMLQSMPVNNYAGAFKAGGMAMNGLRQQAGMQQTLYGQPFSLSDPMLTHITGMDQCDATVWVIIPCNETAPVWT